MIEKHWQAVESRMAQPLAKAFGGSLLEFCWQHAVMATLLPAALRMRSPVLRYGTVCTALGAMVSWPMGAFLGMSIASKSYAVENPPAAVQSPPNETGVGAAFQQQDDGDNKQIADDEGWGPASRGLRCRITPIASDANDKSPDLTKKADLYARGQDLTLAVELKNVGEKTVTLLGGKENIPFIGPHLFDLEFTNEDGEPVRAAREPLTSMLMLIESSTHQIEPGKTFTAVLRPATFHSPMAFQPPPGEYQVRVRYHVDHNVVEQIVKHWPDKPQGKAWMGEVSSQVAAFTVAEDPQPAKSAELRWGEAKDGLRAAVEFLQSGKPLPSDGSQPVPLNTKLDVVIHIQNVGDKIISLASETWRQGDVVTVKDASGKERMLRGAWYTGLPIMARWRLKPNETAEIRAISVGIAADQAAADKFEHPVGPTLIAGPGKYSFQYALRLGDIQTFDAQGNAVAPIGGDRQGELTTGETSVNIRARTAADEVAEQADRFTGRVEFVAKGGKAVEAGVFRVGAIGQREAPTPIDIHAGPIKVPGITPRPVTISVFAPGYEETYFQGVEFKPYEIKRFELTTAEPARFRVIAEGRPVAGAKVRHFNKTSDNASAGPYPVNGLQGPIHAVSAEDGSVVLDSLQKVNHGYENLGAAVYFFYIEAEGYAGRFLGPVKAGADLGDVELSRSLEVRGEIHGTPEELKNFAAEWDQPFELKTANLAAAWSYAISQRLETNREGDKLTFHLTGLRPGPLRIISNFGPPPHHVSHTYTRRDPGESDVVVELELTKPLDDLVITPKGRKAADFGQKE